MMLIFYNFSYLIILFAIPHNDVEAHPSLSCP